MRPMPELNQRFTRSKRPNLWVRLMNWQVTPEQLRLIEAVCRRSEFWLEVLIVAMLAFEATQIVPAFFPGSTVARILRGR